MTFPVGRFYEQYFLRLLNVINPASTGKNQMMIRPGIIRKLILIIFFMGLFLIPPIQADTLSEIQLIDSKSTHLDAWEKQLFQGETHYQKIQLQGQWVIKANSQASASGLSKEVTIDLKQFPYLSWRWLIEKHPQVKDQLTKNGDDFAARIYVVIKDGIFPWQTKAINYVWSKNVKKGAHWANPFVPNAIMVSISNGNGGMGQWQSVTVNVYEDLKRYHHKSFTQIDGIAIMTDSDNSMSSAAARYSHIRFSREKPGRVSLPVKEEHQTVPRN